MKLFFHLFCAVLLLILIEAAQAQQPYKAGGEFDVGQTVKIELHDADIDAHLAEMCRLLNINFLADATHFPLNSTPLSEEMENYPYKVLRRLAIQRNITRLHPDEKVLLFWSKPNVVLLAARMRAGEGTKLEAMPADLDVDQMLLDYFKNTLGWDGQATNYKKNIKISDLPPDVRAPVIAVFQRRLVQNPMSVTPGDLRWLQDGIWDRAFLHVFPESGNKDRTIYAESSLKYVDGKGVEKISNPTTGQGIANLDYNYENDTVVPLNDEEPGAVEHETEEAGPPVPNALQTSDLAQDTALTIKVSFVARRERLGDLMREVQQKSGITLNAAPGSPAATALISAQVNEMPLSTFMASIARLYGVHWSKDGDKTYTLHRSTLSSFDRALVRFGDFDLAPGQGPSFGPDMAHEIFPHLNQKHTLVSTLPPNLQAQLREWIVFGVSGRLVHNQLKISRETMEGYYLRFESPSTTNQDTWFGQNLPSVSLLLPNEIRIGPGPGVLRLHSALNVPGNDYKPTTSEGLIQGVF